MKQGLIYVITGHGKGKTSAAFGIAMRAAGHKLRTLVVQFIKGPWKSGEVLYSQNNIKEIDVYSIGKGFVGICGDKESRSVHRKKSIEAFEFILDKIKKQRYDILVMDEINNALDLGILPLSKLRKFLQSKPAKIHIVLTGRNANQEIIDLADMVSEIKNIKHPFDKGLAAQMGIDY